MTRRLLAVAAALCGTAAVAAPVPKTAPPPAPKASATLTLATAKVVGDNIQITGSVTVMETVMTQEVVVRNGQQETVAVPVTRARQLPQTYQMPLKGTKATAADGKEIGEDDLAKKLGDGAAVVQLNAAVDPEWKKVFADDVIFLESKAPVRPPMPPGGAVLPPLPQPLPAPVVPPPVIVDVVAPPPPPPVEKK